MSIIRILLTLSFCFLATAVFADQKGSDTMVSIEPYFNFPAAPTLSNLIYTFAYFKDGFSLQDSTTTCTWKSIFPISGSINLHGGQLYLTSDFTIHDTAALTTMGSIEGNSHTFDVAQSVTGFPAAFVSRFHHTNIFLNADFVISGTVKFRGLCTLDGGANRVTLGTNGNIIVDRNSTLHLRNVDLEGINRNNIRCLNDGGIIIMDNISWTQSSNYTFTTGTLLFQNDVKVFGQYSFNYTTRMTSSIDAGSMLYFDYGTTFSYAPRIGNKSLIYMTDATSQLYLNGCTLYSTRTGLQLTTGTMFIDNRVTMSSDALYYAEALTLKSNLNLVLLGSANLELFGAVQYE